MTITADIKELREFENKVHDWGVKRGLIAIEAMEAHYRSAGLYTGLNPQNVGPTIKRMLEEWDEKNPPPKLIPDL